MYYYYDVTTFPMFNYQRYYYAIFTTTNTTTTVSLSLLYFSFISFFPRLICLFICILLIAIIEIWLSSTCACVWLCVMIGMFSRARRSNFNVVLVLSMSNLRPRHHISILYFISLSLFTENLTYLVPSYRTT